MSLSVLEIPQQKKNVYQSEANGFTKFCKLLSEPFSSPTITTVQSRISEIGS